MKKKQSSSYWENSQQLQKIHDPQLFLGEEIITPVTKSKEPWILHGPIQEKWSSHKYYKWSVLWTTQKHSHHKTYINTKTCRTIVPSTSYQQTGLLQFSPRWNIANQLVKLQRVQNMVCRVMLCLRKYGLHNITPQRPTLA